MHTTSPRRIIDCEGEVAIVAHSRSIEVLYTGRKSEKALFSRTYLLVIARSALPLGQYESRRELLPPTLYMTAYSERCSTFFALHSTSGGAR